MRRAGFVAAVVLLGVGAQAQVPESRVLLLEQCRIESVEPEGLIVASHVPNIGFIEELLVEEGDFVKEGQVLCRLDDRIAKLDRKIQHERATNTVNVRFAEATNLVAEMTVRKMRAANERVPKTFPEMEVRQAELEEQRTKFQKEQAEYNQTLEEFELERTEIVLDDHEIKSPVSGIVLRIERHRGEPVRQGETILTVLRTDRFRVTGDVSVKDYYRVHKGQPVEVRIVFPNQSGDEVPAQRQRYTGRVVAALPDVIPDRGFGSCKIIAEITGETQWLIPGLQATMTIRLDDARSRLGQAGRPR